MKVLLDECIDRRLSRLLAPHDVKTVQQMGWAGVKNGALMAHAAGRFDVFVTVDRNLAFQQNSSALPMPVVVLRANTNRLTDLVPLAPALLLILQAPLANAIVAINGP